MHRMALVQCSEEPYTGQETICLAKNEACAASSIASVQCNFVA